MRGLSLRDGRKILTVSIFCLLPIVNCSEVPVPKTIEVPITVKGCTDALIDEHDSLFAENIKLKQALKICREKP